MKIISLIIIFLTIIVSLNAQTTFQYQAMARGCDCGALPSQNITVSVQILTGSPTGGAAYSEEHSVTTDATGLFTIDIGDCANTASCNSSNGTFPPIAAWQTFPYYIKAIINQKVEIIQKLKSDNISSIPEIKIDPSCDCDESLAGTVRYFNNGVNMQLCDGENWVNICCGTNCDYDPFFSPEGTIEFANGDLAIDYCPGDIIEMNLFGNSGTIVAWHQRLDGGVWEDIPSSNTYYSHTPTQHGVWEYRAKVSLCDVVIYTNTITATSGIVINPGVLNPDYKTIDLCESTGTMTLTNHVGTIVKWQRSYDNTGIWDDIANTTTTHYETPGTPGIWEYRVVVSTLCAGEEYSTIAEITVNDPCDGVPTVVYEGKTYNTIAMCTQCWLKENLNVGTFLYTTSTSSPELCVNPQTNNAPNSNYIEKHCYDNIETNCDDYGGLYNWDEMMKYNPSDNQGICPDYWHVPTQSEFQLLINNVPSPKSQRLQHSNNNCTITPSDPCDFLGNSGFDALLAGYSCDFNLQGEVGYYWTSSSYASGGSASGYSFTSSSINVGLFGVSISTNFNCSVRCIKD